MVIVTRLLRAAIDPDICRSMEIEDEILTEIEFRDIDIMHKEKELELKRREIEQSKQVIEQKNKMLQEMVRMLTHAGISIEDIAQRLSLSPQEVENLI